MAGSSRDYVEHFEAGLKPHAVREKYYFARGPQLVTRIVDISGSIDQKVESNRANVTQGPAGENGARLRARLASQKKRLPILGNDDETANRAYIKHIVLDVDSIALRGVPSDRELAGATASRAPKRSTTSAPRPPGWSNSSPQTRYRCSEAHRSEINQYARHDRHRRSRPGHRRNTLKHIDVFESRADPALQAYLRQ